MVAGAIVQSFGYTVMLLYALVPLFLTAVVFAVWLKKNNGIPMPN